MYSSARLRPASPQSSSRTSTTPRTRNTCSFEVEQALVEHPSVLEAAVVPYRDKDGLEKPRAFVVLKDGENADCVDTLKDFVKDRIGKWKYPRKVDIVTDLPKTATGKIQRFKLRDVD